MSEFTDIEFRKRFRMSKQVFQELLHEIGPNLQRDDQRGYPVAPELQLMIALRFYAMGCTQTVTGDLVGVSQSTVCRTIEKVTQIIAKLRAKYVKMPENNEELAELKKSFFTSNGIPRIIGCIDGSHVPIQSPGGVYAELFRNRKMYFSINVQAVVNARCEFMDIVAKWHGSAHDQTVFNFSKIKQRFEQNEFGDGLLIGDAGYGCSKYMLTPFRNPITQQQKNYNKALSSTRSCVERTFGQWKRKFRVLTIKSEISLDKFMAIVVATAVVHNFIRKYDGYGSDDDSDDDSDDELNLEVPVPPPNQYEVNVNPNIRDEVMVSMFGN